MRFKINTTEEDYINFNIFAGRHTAVGKRGFMTGRLLTAFISVFALILIWIFTEDIWFVLIEGVVLGIVSAIWFAIYPKIYKRSIRKNMERMKKDGKLPYHEEEELDFGDEEIIGTTEREVIRRRYDEIPRIDVTDEYMFIWIDSARAWPVPMRCLGDRSAELMELLKEKVGDRIKVAI